MLMMCCYFFVFQNGKNSVQEELLPLICYFSKTVSSVSDKKHMEALGSCRFHSKCSSTVTLSHTAVSTSSLAKSREGGSVRKMLLGISTEQSLWAPLWKPGEFGWSPKTPRRNPPRVCSIVGKLKMQGLMAPLCALLWGSGQSDQF